MVWYGMVWYGMVCMYVYIYTQIYMYKYPSWTCVFLALPLWLVFRLPNFIRWPRIVSACTRMSWCSLRRALLHRRAPCANPIPSPWGPKRIYIYIHTYTYIYIYIPFSLSLRTKAKTAVIGFEEVLPVGKGGIRPTDSNGSMERSTIFNG